MPDVFINYRTSDGEQAATTLERELSHRFGEGRIFRASKSIEPGELFDDELLRSVRRSGVLLAVIGESWAKSDRLADPADWVRKEIVEAFRAAVPVVPVLVGRGTDRLVAAELPTALRKLARCHSLRYSTQNHEYDLRRIGDALAHRLPELAEAEHRLASAADEEAAGAGSVQNSTGDVGGSAVQGGSIGDVTTIRDVHGPLHTGSGSQHQPHFSGDGSQYIAGDNQGGIHQDFGGKKRRKDGDR
jgi:hypothetical protein